MLGIIHDSNAQYRIFPPPDRHYRSRTIVRGKRFNLKIFFTISLLCISHVAVTLSQDQLYVIRYCRTCHVKLSISHDVFDVIDENVEADWERVLPHHQTVRGPVPVKYQESFLSRP